MIRKAVPADLEDIVELGVEFGNVTKKIHTMEVNENKIRAVARASIVDPKGVMLVEEYGAKIQGVLFGVELSAFFSEDIVLQEMALYSHRATGLLYLIEAFEEEAKCRGIKKVCFGSKPDFCNLGKVYTRRGYKLFEDHFIKEL